MTSNEDGGNWDSYRRMVISALADLQTKVNSLGGQVTQLGTDIAVWKSEDITKEVSKLSAQMTEMRTEAEVMRRTGRLLMWLAGVVGGFLSFVLSNVPKVVEIFRGP